MKIEQKWIWIGLGVVAVATTGYIIYSNSQALKGKKKEEQELKEGGGETYEAGTEEQSSAQYKRSEKLTPTTMVIGSKGRPVGILQAWLNYKYGTNVKVDGRYGTELRDALKDKLGWYCGSIVGDSSCTIKSTDTPAKEMLQALRTKDKGFSNYFMKVYPAVGREFEPVVWGGVGLTAKY